MPYPRQLTTQARENVGPTGEPWWNMLVDNRSAGWDESADEGPDEGPPYQTFAPAAWDQHAYQFAPQTGPYGKGVMPQTWSEPDPRDEALPAAQGAWERSSYAPSRAMDGLGERRRGAAPRRGIDLGTADGSGGLGDLVQVIEGLKGPPYAYYGGSAFEPKELPEYGAMWLPGYRLARKMPGDAGTVFWSPDDGHKHGPNPPYRWTEESGLTREYPSWDDPGYPSWVDPVRGPGPEGEYGDDLTARMYAQPIQAKIPTGWAIRTGLQPRGHYIPGDVGPSVAGFGGLGLTAEQIEALKAAAAAAKAAEEGRIPPAPAASWIPWAVGGVAAVGLIAWFASRR